MRAPRRPEYRPSRDCKTMNSPELPREKIEGGLEIHPHRRHHAAAWRIKHFAWAAMALILAAACAGAFGRGRLSRETLRDTSGRLALERERVVRRDAPAQWTLRLGGEAVGPLRISIDQDSAAWMNITRIDPQPERVETGGGRLHYVFHRTTGAAPCVILFFFEPLQFGRKESELEASDGARLRFATWVFP